MSDQRPGYFDVNPTDARDFLRKIKGGIEPTITEVERIEYYTNLLLSEPTRLEEAEQILAFYGNPGTYFAIAFIGDEPTGDFMNDFSDTPELGWKPGHRARQYFTKWLGR